MSAITISDMRHLKIRIDSASFLLGEVITYAADGEISPDQAQKSVEEITKNLALAIKQP